MRTVISVAIGEAYEIEAQVLASQVPELLLVTDKHPLYQEVCHNPFINGLHAKTSVGRFLPDDAEGSVFFCDADLWSVDGKNHIDDFVADPKWDIAMVPYQGTFHYPKGSKRKEIHEKIGGNFNSGFIYFRNADICREISELWSENYRRRMGVGGTLNRSAFGEYDEPALLEVLAYKGDWVCGVLPLKWNNWLEPREDDYFRQTHTVVGRHISDYTENQRPMIVQHFNIFE